MGGYPSFPVSWLDLFPRRGWQIIFGTHHLFSGLLLQVQARFLCDSTALLARLCIFGHAGGLHALGDLAGGEFGQRGENQFRCAHVVAQVLGLQSFDVLVILYRQVRPFLVDDIGQDGVFVSRGPSSNP